MRWRGPCAEPEEIGREHLDVEAGELMSEGSSNRLGVPLPLGCEVGVVSAPDHAFDVMRCFGMDDDVNPGPHPAGREAAIFEIVDTARSTGQNDDILPRSRNTNVQQRPIISWNQHRSHIHTRPGSRR